MKVGVIGLGNMGLQMARRLLEEGHELRVHARRSRRVSGSGNSAVWCNTPRSCADGVEVLLTCLPDGDAVGAVLDGEFGALGGLGADGVVVDMSTIGVTRAMGVAATCVGHGIAFLDAPVSGGPMGAASGSLGIMVGGPEAAYRRALPVLDSLGVPELVGPTGSGQLLKLVNQVMVAVTMAGVAEAFALADTEMAAGALNVLSRGMADSRLLRFAWPRMLAGDWAPGFRVEHMIKDLELVGELAGERGVQLGVLRAALTQFRAAREAAGPGAGTQSVLLAVARGDRDG